MSVHAATWWASVPARRRAVCILRCGLVVALLLAPAAWAQQEPEAGAAATEVEDAAASEAAAEADAAEAAQTVEPITEIEPFQDPDIEEIVVRGELTSGTAMDAPISAVGFDSDVILQEGIKDIRDLSNFTPSLEIKSAFAASNPTIFIRGVGLDDFNANAPSAVAIYQDNVYMQSPAGQLFQFFDVEGVEVLRGPQGALYRSASAGAILIRSQKPTDEPEAYLTGTYGNFNAIEVMGAVGGPLVPDWLAGRLSGTWGVRDGITKNRCAELGPPDPKRPCDQQRKDLTFVVEEGLASHTNDVDAYGARAQLLLRPPSVDTDTEWLWNAHGGQNFSRAFQSQHRGVQFKASLPGEELTAPTPLPLDPPKPDFSNYTQSPETIHDPFAGDYDIDGPEELALWGSSLQGIWRFGDFYELKSITAYEWHDRFTLENGDANPKFLLENEYGDTAWQVSQEFSLAGEWAPTETGSGSWITGVYYLQEDLDVENKFRASGVPNLTQQYSQIMRNVAAYAQSEYKIEPGCAPVSCDFTFDLGIRYNVEFKEFDILTTNDATDEDPVTIAGTEDATWDGLSGEASLAWHFNEVSNIYLKYSRGWKGGHFNAGATSRFDVITGVDPETVDSYEGGLRSLWFDEQVMLNLTGFYYDYQDLQVFQLEQTPAGFPISKLINSDTAVVFGVELDMGASPIDGLNLTYNFAWVESEYTDFKTTLPFIRRIPKPGGGFFRPPLTTRVEFDYSGNPLIASPRFSMTGSVDYTIQLPGSVGRYGLGTLTPRFSFSWKDDVFFDAGSGTGQLLNFPEATFGQEAFWIFNTALAWRSDDERLEVVGWAHNFLDTHYKTQSFDLSRGVRIILDAYADPRTYGLTATVSF